jgi:hypothetical protein
MSRPVRTWTEEHQVSWAHRFCWDRLASPKLIVRDARHIHSILSEGVLHQARTIKTNSVRTLRNTLTRAARPTTTPRVWNATHLKRSSNDGLPNL